MEGLALDDTECRKLTAHFHVSGVHIFMLDIAVDYLERRAVGGIKHVSRHIRCVRELHWFRFGLVADRIDAGLLHHVNGFCELSRVREEAPPEHEHTISAGAVREVSGRWRS